jgi:hypothetical protein
VNHYEAKVAARKERQADRAEKLAREAQASFDRVHRIADGIPFGQPILVGHHSERHHRADIKRMDNGMRKGIELSKQAAELSRRAETESTAISSDDPDATDKLTEKIAKLDALQAKMAATNKLVRKNDRPGLTAMGYSEKAIEGLFTPDFCGRIGFASYQLTNNNANIRRLKERVASLAKKATQEARPDIEGEGYIIREDVEDNRLLIVFDKIPDKERRTKLKRSGFKWSPTRSAWVRMLNNSARLAAEWALK